MNRKLIISAVALVAVLGSTAAACDDTPKNQVNENKQAQVGQQTLLTSQPVPAFNWSQLRQNLIEIETAQATGVQTNTLFFNQGVQDPVQSCPSIGAPIATTTELTNPQQVARYNNDYGGNAVIGQMDPTGVYTGDSTGTYVMCVGGNGKPYAVYWEGHVMTTFGPSHWDKAAHQVVMDGPASFNFTKGH